MFALLGAAALAPRCGVAAPSLGWLEVDVQLVAVPVRHERDRPGWGCTVCGREWPCEAARAELAEEYAADPVALAVDMCSELHDAVRDMPHARPTELFERFVSWTR